MADNSKITLGQLKTAMTQSKNYTDASYDNLNQQIKDILERLGILENYHKVKIYNIPRLNLVGDISTMSADVACELDCELLDVYGEPIFADKKCKMTWQGNSSLNWSKKNFSIKLYENDLITKYKYQFFDDVKADSGYHLKSDWEDCIRMKNIVSATIAESMYSKKLPSGGRSTMEGFEIQIYINDKYQGLYSWNTKQGDKVYKLDETNLNHLMYRANGSSASTCRFRALSINNAEDISNEWEDRFPGTNTPENRDKLNRMIQWVMDCENDLDKFKNELEQYFDKEYLIKYTILAYVGGMWDNIANNFNLITFDGLVWYPTFYDMDSTWGYHYESSPISTSYAFPDDYHGGDSLLFNLVMNAFGETDLKTTYKELRQGVLSYNNIVAVFDDKLAEMTQEELTKDLNKWGALHTDYNLAAIKSWIKDRLDYVDSQIINETISVTGISLNNNTLSLAKGASGTLTYTITPDTATNKNVTWSASNDNCTVNNGLVTAVNEGECIITVTSNDTTNGTISDTCTVTVIPQSSTNELLCELQANNHGSDLTTWTDLSGKGNDAILVNLTASSEWINNQLHIAGDNGYVKLNSNLDAVLDFTIEINGKFSFSHNKTIFSKRNSWSDMILTLYIQGNTNDLRFETQELYNCSSSMDYDVENTLKCYISPANNTIILHVNGNEVLNKTDVTFTYPSSMSSITIGNSIGEFEGADMYINYIKVYQGNAI